MASADLHPRDAVITGVGVVCPLGLTAQELWTGLCEGRYGIGPFSLTSQNVSAGSARNHEPVKIAAPVRSFTGAMENFGNLPTEIAKSVRKGLKLMCRESQMAVAAALRALQDAGWQPESFPPERCGVLFGCDHLLSLPEEFINAIKACMDEGTFRFSRWGSDGLGQMTPLWLLKYLPNMPASHIAIYCQFCGPSNSITLREASALVALGEAKRLIADNHVDLLVVGATGCRLHPMRLIHALTQDQVVRDGDPTTACRPFDRDRAGTVLGEGAAAVVVEAWESAKRRAREPYGKIAAVASACKLGPRCQADQKGAVELVLRRLAASGNPLGASAGFVSAQGSGTYAADRAEAQAIATVFGSGDKAPPVVAAKAYTGHMGSGSAVTELIAGLMALKSGRLYPIRNFRTPDPQCPVRVVTQEEVPAGQWFIQLAFTQQAQAAGVLVTRANA